MAVILLCLESIKLYLKITDDYIGEISNVDKKPN